MSKKIVNLNNEYAKPETIEVVIKGAGKFVVLESVLHSLMDTLGFKRDGGEIGSDFVCFKYKPVKRKK